MMNKFAAVMLTFCFNTECQAAVITDGTVGAPTTLIGPNFNIAASLGTQVGLNLFHSFSTFGLAAGESATFMDLGVSNIIARVTGGSASSIDGLLATSAGSTANLYLLNPSGIFFGANASLNIGGAFTATTADYMRFADGNTFDATIPSNSILTTAAPSAFGFLSANVAPIRSQAWLSVPDGQTLALIGGDVTATGDLSALGGKINIASVASAGEVGLTPSLDVSGFASLGSIFLNSRVDVSENWFAPSSILQSGSIYIQGGTIVVGPAGGLFSNTMTNAGGDIAVAASDALTIQGILSATTFGGGTGGDINLDANTLTLDYGYIFADTQSGNAGAVNINANQLSIVNGSWVSSDAGVDSMGNGGSVNVNVTGAFTMTSSKVSTMANGSGNGGSIALSAFSIALDDSVVLANTYGVGKAGSVLVNATQLDILNFSKLSSDTHGTGNGGDITLNASNIVLNNGLVFADAYAAGSAGTVSINASQMDVQNFSWVSSDGLSFSSGNAGQVNLNIANQLAIGGWSKISSVAKGLGNGGDIVIQAASMTLDNSKIYADSSLSGNAGSITINANQLSLVNGSKVSSDAVVGSEGNGGHVNVNVTGALMMTNSKVTTMANGLGNGGGVSLRASSIVLDNSDVLANTYGLGNAGSVLVNAAQLDILNVSTLSSDTHGAGNGGRITLNASSLLLNNGGVFADAYDAGSAGTVTINASQMDVQNSSWVSSDGISFSSGNAGQVSLNVAKQLVISGSSQISSVADGLGNGGDIVIQAAAMTVDNSKIYADSSLSGNAGSVTINANQLDVLNGSQVSSNGLSFSSGNAGQVNLNVAKQLAISGSSQISSVADGLGNGGDIVIQAAAMTVDNSKIYADSSLSGNAGSVTINANQLDVLNGSQVSSFSKYVGNAGAININVTGLFSARKSSFLSSAHWGGNGGPITLSADRMLLDDTMVFADTFDIGNAGTVRLKANQMVIANGSWVSSDTLGLIGGNAGSVYLDAAGSLNVSNSKITSETRGTGSGGSLNINAGSVILNNSAVYADARETGNAGAVHINAAWLDILNGTWISSDTLGGSGHAGNLNISVSQSMSLRGGSQITTESWGMGRAGSIAIQTGTSLVMRDATMSSASRGLGIAGDIAINAGDALRMENSVISTQADIADGGNISVLAKELIYANNSIVSATVMSGLGGGGNIFLDPTFIVLNNSAIIANAFGGPGGNINLVANNFIPSSNSIVSASSQLGVSGTVTVTSQFTDLSGGLLGLQANYLDATGLLRAPCKAKVADKTSSFLQLGRGGIPLSPEDYISSSLLKSAPSGVALFAGLAGGCV